MLMCAQRAWLASNLPSLFSELLRSRKFDFIAKNAANDCKCDLSCIYCGLVLSQIISILHLITGLKDVHAQFSYIFNLGDDMKSLLRGSILGDELFTAYFYMFFSVFLLMNKINNFIWDTNVISVCTTFVSYMHSQVHILFILPP